MFIIATVLDWRTKERRVPNVIAQDIYILNTNRMFEITEDHDGNAQMWFYDNPVDTRDGGSRMKLDTTVANIMTIADFDVGSTSVTFDIFPENDNTQTPVSTTIPKAAISCAYAADSDGNDTWVEYIEDGWDFKRVLVDEDVLFAWLELLT